MEIVRIFVSDVGTDGIWSVQLKDEPQNEFANFFNRVSDIEWLTQFFERNKRDLLTGFYGNITIEDAILRTVNEAEKMEEKLYELVDNSFWSSINLQHIFKPLNNFEYSITIHQKSKASILQSWLRLYAIRLSENCYVVTGGAIKLTRDMKREHLAVELNKLDQARDIMKENNIYYPEDLNTNQDD